MAFPGRSLDNMRSICVAKGKVKCTDISLPSSDFKPGKLVVLRVGNSDLFYVGIQQNTAVRLTKKITVSKRLAWILWLKLLKLFERIALRLKAVDSFNITNLFLLV
jgi:hypothetical protein